MWIFLFKGNDEKWKEASGWNQKKTDGCGHEINIARMPYFKKNSIGRRFWKIVWYKIENGWIPNQQFNVWNESNILFERFIKHYTSFQLPDKQKILYEQGEHY